MFLRIRGVRGSERCYSGSGDWEDQKDFIEDQGSERIREI